MTDYRIREATTADAEVVNAFRQAMFLDMGEQPGPELDAVGERYLPWLRERLNDGRFRAWLAEVDGEPVASTGLWFKEVQPSPRNPLTQVGYIINVYTKQEHRRRGLARRLVQAGVDASKAAGFSVVELHASDDGRPLYASMGFVQTNEMRLRL
jgi:GNAT superfamily N-acetyltransferase